MARQPSCPKTIQRPADALWWGRVGSLGALGSFPSLSRPASCGERTGAMTPFSLHKTPTTGSNSGLPRSQPRLSKGWRLSQGGATCLEGWEWVRAQALKGRGGLTMFCLRARRRGLTGLCCGQPASPPASQVNRPASTARGHGSQTARPELGLLDPPPGPVTPGPLCAQ